MFNVFDCGARGGKHRSWKNVGIDVNYFMFEPEGKEYEKLSISNSTSDCCENVINAAIGETNSVGTLNIYSDPSLSSLLELKNNPLMRYKDVVLEQKVTVNITSIAEICKDFSLHPHFLCIDAQGTTLDILKGCDSRIEQVLGIRAEAEFFEFYRGEKTIFEVGSWLLQNGFEMVRFETCGPGTFGPSSDMNEFSVDREDAKPVWADFIFVNQKLIEDGLGNQDQYRNLVGLIVFLIHNRCGYLAADLFYKLNANYLLGLSRELLGIVLSQIHYYLLLNRKDYNAERSYKNELAVVTKLAKKTGVDINLPIEVRSKLDDIYNVSS